MKYYQLMEAEPDRFHFPNDEGPDVAELRAKLKKLEEQRESKQDPILTIGDYAATIVLLPVLIPVVIIAAIVYFIQRRHES